MIIPIRCFTCNKVLASKYGKYKALIQAEDERRLHAQQPKLDNILAGDDITISDTTHSSEITELYKDIFKQIGVERYCCKRCLISHVDLIDKI
jgi:DNA-directed RNA polymerase subunit N|tara:strand:- start:257 stop:535 length:279 start_codon:yes stop_codon:yes gene_type:complete